MPLGQGNFRYELVPDWEQIPNGWSHGDVAGVATDSQDRAYVFNRGEHPLLVYNRDGSYIKSWGEGVFTRPHGITIHNDILYLADDGDHTVRKFTLEGELLETLGTPNLPSDTGYSATRQHANLLTIERGAGPFNRPTRLSVAPNGERYVSDGYGNARIHRFSASGELLQSWGGPGKEHGQFMLPHSVWVHTDGRVFVCDRENDRIQIFGPEGQFLDCWENVQRPGDLFIDKDEKVFIGQMYWQPGLVSIAGFAWPDERPAHMTIRDMNGKLISRFGAPPKEDPCIAGNLTSPHGIWVDSRGDIYVGEVSKTSYEGGIFRPGCHTIQKFRRV